MKYITQGNKELEVVNEGMSSRIKFVGGGQLPDELEGIFTSHSFAIQRIQEYLANRLPKGKQGA
jgi:hypothetical protein